MRNLRKLTYKGGECLTEPLRQARQENVTTSLQPHNLQNRLHALYTSAMLQRYNLFVAAGGSSRGKSAVDYLFAQRSSLLVRGRLRAGGRQHQLGTEEYEV